MSGLKRVSKNSEFFKKKFKNFSGINFIREIDRVKL
jgi:hypothetical protein